MSSRVQFEYDKELMNLSVSVNDGASKTISVRELEPMEKILSMLKIPYESFVGGMMADTDYLKFQYDNDSLYKLGVEAGVKQMMDKIQKHCELGKPVLANGELYFFKDARQNLIDIMDDIDAEYGIPKRKKYIVPIHRGKGEKYVERMAVIIEANSPDEATAQAVFSFGYGGWTVDTNSKDYKTME